MCVCSRTCSSNTKITWGLRILNVQVTFILEVLRFQCFAVLWVKQNLQDVACSVLLSILGEIYTHTELWQLRNNEWQMKRYGRRYHEFSGVFYWGSSIRSLIGYAAAIYKTQCQPLIYWQSKKAWISNFFSKNIFNDDRNIPQIDWVWKALLVYNVFELVSEIVCRAIRKLSL